MVLYNIGDDIFMDMSLYELLKVDKNSPLPLYYQIKKQISDKIHSGELKPKTRIPSEMEVAKINDISPMTVRQAYKELVNDGVLYRRHGKGTYVADDRKENTSDDSGAPPVKNSTDIGVLFRELNQSFAFHSKLILGIEEACSEFLYKMHLFNVSGPSLDAPDNLLLTQLAQSGSLDGLIITPGALKGSDIRTLRQMKTPFVLVENDFKDVDAVSISADDRAFASNAVSFLVANGKRNIALLCGPIPKSDDVKFLRKGAHLLSAYRESLEKASIPFNPDLVRESDCSEESALRAAKEIFSSPVVPDAVITNGDIITAGLLRMMRERGTPPEKTQILNYGDTINSPFRFIAKPYFELGKASLAFLRKLMRDDIPQNKRIIVPLSM